MKKNTLLLVCCLMITAALQAQVTSTDGTFTAGGTTNLTLNAGAATRFTILGSGTSVGNVGIGTTSPSDKLHVNGDIRATQFNSVNGVFQVQHSTNNMSFRTSGTPRMTIINSGTTAGFVGIGKTNPAYMLDVAGPINATGIYVNDVLITGGGSSQWTTAAGSELYYNSGFVGIGNTNPDEMLHVTGNAKANQLIATNGIYSSASTSNLFLRTNTTDRVTILNTNGYVGIGTSPLEMLHVNGNVLSTGTVVANGNVSGFSVLSTNGQYNTAAATDLSLNTNGTSRVTVLNSNGNVGIGVANPADRLHVAGNITVENGATPMVFTGIGSSELNRYLHISNSSALQNASGLKAGGLLVADAYNYANPSKNDLIVKGKVGIGTPLTSNPHNYMLAVNGNIGAKDVRVERSSAAWPDYVFSSDYKLPDLKQVEQFVKENNHLEGVPSAEEVNKNGHSLNDMDVVLLKKVEELTLYIIEQQKQIDALKKKLEEKE